MSTELHKSDDVQLIRDLFGISDDLSSFLLSVRSLWFKTLKTQYVFIFPDNNAEAGTLRGHVQLSGGRTCSME